MSLQNMWRRQAETISRRNKRPIVKIAFWSYDIGRDETRCIANIPVYRNAYEATYKHQGPEAVTICLITVKHERTGAVMRFEIPAMSRYTLMHGDTYSFELPEGLREP